MINNVIIIFTLFYLMKWKFLIYILVQITLDATRAVQKQQAALNAANQSLHAAFEGWSSVETNPTSIYLNAKSFEANSCEFMNSILKQYLVFNLFQKVQWN